MTDHKWRIVVADNGSTDETYSIAQDYAARHQEEISAIRLPEKGRGRALHKAWSESTADIVCYMDVDLSTDLAALPLLIDAIALEGFDIAVGSRLLNNARVSKRSAKREIISRCYNLLIKLLFHTKFSDAQCGFKALNRKAVEEIMPVTVDRGWFFDTEILIIAEKRGYQIKDVPVHWTDDPDTRVRVLSTAWRDLRGLMRLRLKGVPRPIRTR